MNQVCHLKAHAKGGFFYIQVPTFNFQVHTEKENSSMVYHSPFLYKIIPIRAGWKQEFHFMTGFKALIFGFFPRGLLEN